VSAGRIWRRRLIALGILAALIVAGYWFWLRDSSLVAVEDVEVEGASTNAEEIQATLEPVAEEMTTLNVDEGKLVEAVSAFPTVASIAVDASIPHKLTITVTERLPVAVVRSGGDAVGVSADGYALPGVPVEGEGFPAIEAEVADGRLDEAGAAQAAILGGAPQELRDKVEDITWDESRGGVVVELVDAPEARFGDGSDAEDKWTALATLLLQPGAGAAGYANVEVPERGVLGG
jgi:cell division protein FtsQ